MREAVQRHALAALPARQRVGQLQQLFVRKTAVVRSLGLTVLHKTNYCLQVTQGSEASSEEIPVQAIYPGLSEGVRAPESADHRFADQCNLAGRFCPLEASQFVIDLLAMGSRSFGLPPPPLGIAMALVALAHS